MASARSSPSSVARSTQADVAEPRSRPFLDQDHDLVVIGGGAAGRGAARAARWSGAHVALVSDDIIGGCLPHTAFVFATRRVRDFARALADARGTVAVGNERDTVAALRNEGIEVIEGRARFVDPGEIEVGSTRLRSGRFVIATGSRPAIPQIRGLDTVDALLPDDLWQLHAAPESIAIVGAGGTGCELAQSFARVGVRVVLFEERERVLPREEPAASAVVAAALRGEGVEVRQGARVRAVERVGPGRVRVSAERGESVEVERLVAVVGRVPYTEGLDLHAAGAAVDAAGFVRVDGHLRTTARGTYAAGDVTGLLPYAHAADEMGRLAAGHALKHGPRGRFHARWIPRVTFTDPEVAALGISEHDAPRWARVAEVPYSSVDRAIAEGRTEGYCKLIAAPRPPTGRLLGGRLLGATVVAPNAGELVAEITLAMRAGMFPARLAQAVHAYPTWSSAVQECAAQFVVEVNGRRARPPRR
jgi:pyruvate/2-oxoglutarate dehydrogenase complex dihydrolipoamide dehydrogenase (E3) component